MICMFSATLLGICVCNVYACSQLQIVCMFSAVVLVICVCNICLCMSKITHGLV